MKNMASMFTVASLVLIVVLVSCGDSEESMPTMYWTDFGTNIIQRANIDGTDVQELVTGLGAPIDIAIDVSAGKMYWTNRDTDMIQRANLDGSDVEDLYTGIDMPYGIALDTTAKMVYWVYAASPPEKVQRAAMDGSGLVEDLFVDIGNAPYGLELDIAAGKMYWTDSSEITIQRANMDGTGDIEDLFTETDGITIPLGIALDVAANMMYWVDEGPEKIRRADMVLSVT